MNEPTHWSVVPSEDEVETGDVNNNRNGETLYTKPKFLFNIVVASGRNFVIIDFK
jgi:hypothetical protein